MKPIFNKAVKWLALGLLSINLLAGSFAVLKLHQSRQQYEESTQITVRNIALLLDHDIAAAMQRVNFVLMNVIDEYQRQEKNGSPDAQSLNFFIASQHKRQPDIDGMFVSDGHGAAAYGTGVDLPQGLNGDMRGFFARLRDAPSAELVISQPFLDQVQSKWVIALARRINRPDGTFAGIAYATMTLARLNQIFSALDLGRNGVVTLFDDSMRVMLRYPDLHAPGSAVGMKFGSPQLKALVKSGRSEGSFTAASTIDGVLRMHALRKVDHIPLYVAVGLASKDYLRAWYGEAAKTAASVIFFALMTLFLSWLIYRTWKSQELTVEALKEANRTLDAEKELNMAVIQSSPLAIHVRDRNKDIIFWNDAAAQMYGWPPAGTSGKALRLMPEETPPQCDALGKRVLNGEKIVQAELSIRRRDGSDVEISMTMAPLHDAAGEIYGYLAIAADITKRKQAEQRIQFLAQHDALTGLPNRLLAQDRFRQALAAARRTGSKVALAFLDLDNFKAINDSLGHAIGDALLKEIAARLAECVRGTDTVSRQGGDEFLILLPDLPDVDSVAPVIDKLKEGLQAAFFIDGNELSTSASIGVAVHPQDGDSFDILLKKADMAMYRAKDAGRNTYRFFDERMNTEAVDNLAVRNGLRRALEHGEFVLQYQPQIDLASGAIIGAEALIRWHHPDKGMIPPGQFIHVAEESGLIVPIGAWVMEEACRQAAEWRKAGLPDMVMAVNLSAVQFKREDVESAVMNALEKSGLQPEYLELELTESILINDAESVLATVKRLKLLGVKLSIDDFGTGYSSLSYLKRFDVDKLKIDRSFVRDLGSDADDAAIVRAIIQMAHSLNLKTIAEGVEDESMLSHLRIYRCDEAQGYHFARPMFADDFAAFALRRAATSA